MAYRFGTNDLVDFNPAPLLGYIAGPVTLAFLHKVNTTGEFGNEYLGVFGSGGANRFFIGRNFSNKPRYTHETYNREALTVLLNDTSKWYLTAVTFNGDGTTPRFHIHDGTSWTHDNADGTVGWHVTIGAADTIRVGKFLWPPNTDVVCAGIKKANHTDGQIETLTRTDFQSWRAFGFDWLVGFETSGTVLDQAAPGTGDETSRIGTTLVSDPAGWTWTTVAATTVTRDISLVL